MSLPCTAIENLGSVPYLCTAPGDDATLIAELKVSTTAASGGQVTMSIDPAACFLFETDGRRI